MADLKEQLVCIKFCFKLMKSATEILNTMEVACVKSGRPQILGTF
jgi:hypothetical protein